MPPLPKRPCSYSPWCNEPVTRRGLCATHLTPIERDEHPNARFYNSAAWRTLRAKVLRLEPNCRRCGKPATDVDHVTALDDGGPPLDLANLQPLCAGCHMAKTYADRRARAQGEG